MKIFLLPTSFAAAIAKDQFPFLLATFLPLPFLRSCYHLTQVNRSPPSKMAFMLDQPSHSVTHNFRNGALDQKLAFSPNSGQEGQGIFYLYAGLAVHQDYTKCLLVQVVRHDVADFFKVKITIKNNDQEASDELTVARTSRSFARDWFVVDYPTKISLTFEFKAKRRTLFDDLRKFSGKVEQVTIAGSDGDVLVPKFLVDVRLHSCRSLIKSKSGTDQSNMVDLKNFDTGTLNAFKTFLLEDMIEAGNEKFAVQLYDLGMELSFEPLIQAAKYTVMKHIGNFDQEEIFDSLINANRLFVEDQYLKSLNQ